MNSGELSDSERFYQDERTAFFVSVAGVYIQSCLGAQGKGISSKKLYKVLANAIWDWHWLSFKSPATYEFRGIGRLMWSPSRYGAVGQVLSKEAYKFGSLKEDQRTFISVKSVFESIPKLLGSREYAKYGTKILSNGKKTTLLFANSIPYSLLSKAPVENKEHHYWKLLVESYAAVNDNALNALASCRNMTALVHNLWIQIVYWRSYMMEALKRVPAKGPEIGDLFNDANGCIYQLRLKIDFFTNIALHTNALLEATAFNELHGQIPVRDEPIGQDNLQKTDEVQRLLNACTLVIRLHEVCEEVQKMAGFKPGPLSWKEFEPKMRELRDWVVNLGNPIWEGFESRLLGPLRWHKFYEDLDAGSAANHCSILVINVLDALEKYMDRRLKTPTIHHLDFVLSAYPLPDKHFLRGF